MLKEDYFKLNVITYNEIRNLGHRQQSGIFKPRDSKYAYSIITNVGESIQNYEDRLEEDLTLIYHGRGKDKDQTLDDYDNQALADNFDDNIPLKVFAGGDNKYRDWSNWIIIDMDTEIGRDGFLKLVYKLKPLAFFEKTNDSGNQQVVSNQVFRYANRKIKLVNQQTRYAPELRKLKESYNYVCQVDMRHELPGRKGRKAHVHHLEPVGPGGVLVSPKHSNEIVLCPNCHELFDDGSLWIDPNDGITIKHWNKDSFYEGKKLNFIEGHVLDKKLLKRVYQLHWGEN